MLYAIPVQIRPVGPAAAPSTRRQRGVPGVAKDVHQADPMRDDWVQAVRASSMCPTKSATENRAQRNPRNKRASRRRR